MKLKFKLSANKNTYIGGIELMPSIRVSFNKEDGGNFISLSLFGLRLTIRTLYSWENKELIKTKKMSHILSRPSVCTFVSNDSTFKEPIVYDEKGNFVGFNCLKLEKVKSKIETLKCS